MAERHEHNSSKKTSIKKKKTSILPKSIISSLHTKEDLENALSSINIDYPHNEQSYKETKDLQEEKDCMETINLRRDDIKKTRSSAILNLNIQAEKMKAASENKFTVGKVGETVKIRIPDVDRARSDLRNILGVILSVDEDKYGIGTSSGILAQLYSRNQFTICKQTLIDVKDIPKTKISLREHARSTSNLGGQGFDKCFCTQKCKNNKCRCKNSGKLCNSKCHGGNNCLNK